MRILVVSSFLPYPLFSGGHIRLYNLIKRLTQRNHEVTLICEKRTHQTEDDVKEVQKICKQVIWVARRKQWSLENILRTGFSQDAFLISGHRNEEMQYKIQETLQQHQFDFIHVETSYVMQNIPQTSLPIVLVEHNIEYLVYQRMAQGAAFFLRPLLMIDVEKLRKIEERFWQQATHIVTVSEKEKEIIGLPNVSIVENGVDLEVFPMKQTVSISSKREVGLLFIGDFSWIQNRDAVRWIIKDILPKITAYFRETRKISLWVVGKNIPGAIKHMQTEENVIFDENSRSTSEIFQQADILLAPIRVGGGTQYKILEAMASGTPVVTTQLGIEGIGAKDGENVIVGETAHELAEKTAHIMQHDDYYVTIAQNARKLIEERYTWDRIIEKLESVYKQLLENKNG